MDTLASSRLRPFRRLGSTRGLLMIVPGLEAGCLQCGTFREVISPLSRRENGNSKPPQCGEAFEAVAGRGAAAGEEITKHFGVAPNL